MTSPTLVDEEDDASKSYRALVVDSGPIIKMTGLTNLRGKAFSYFTVPAVLTEIRDAKARFHLDELPFQIQAREPTSEGLQAVIEFSRKTGDFQSLSSVDLQVLALHFDLEKEGCGTDHIRRTPKRMLGVGKVQVLGSKMKNESSRDDKVTNECSEKNENLNSHFIDGDDYDLVEASDDDDDSESNEKYEKVENFKDSDNGTPKTWAKIVNPSASGSLPLVSSDAENLVTEIFSFDKLRLSEEPGGQFSDAEDDDFDPLCTRHTSDDDEDESDDEYAKSDVEISDEECDVYILDPDEVEKRKSIISDSEASAIQSSINSAIQGVQKEFPNLVVTTKDPNNDDDEINMTPAELARKRADKLREQALLPKSNSGKSYNSFRKYNHVMKPKEISAKVESLDNSTNHSEVTSVEKKNELQGDMQSRIMGGSFFSGQGTEVEDDGEGWITSSKEILRMKSSGRFDLTSNPSTLSDNQDKLSKGPPTCLRTACATTDFAMQNVILQMNLELLSVDGYKIRRIKNWVSRCGACFTVYSNDSSSTLKRLFCSRCGSDLIQRVACSVDGKTGRLKLHLSKKYKNNLRGTKFSLPKPGRNNRFQGDLLLREDQLLMGAWSQKVKKMSGGKARSSASSIFGTDLPASLGCHAKLANVDEIRVGFGKRNPNSATGGRERRGKKKKSGDKACGLRRY
jgi:RNA-binding protein NOB1